MVKTELKAAKKALEDNDPDTAIYYVGEVLEEDPKNYFALIFEGKAYQLLKKPREATKAYKKAIDVDGNNLLGWKGLFQVVRLLNPPESDKVFEVATQLALIQEDQGILPADTLKDVKNYLDAVGYKTNPEIFRQFVDATRPGTDFGDIVGTSLGTRQDNLIHLINLVKKPVDEQVAKVLMKERVKLGKVLSPEQRKSYDSQIYAIYNLLLLLDLYDQLLEVSNDDDVRTKYKEDKLRFLLDLLQCAPNKKEIYGEAKDLIDDMVMLNVPLVFAWQLYFDWADFELLSPRHIPTDRIIRYLQQFPSDSLSTMLYAFVLSDMLNFDRARIVSETGGAMGLPQEKQAEEEEGIDDEERELIDDDTTVDKNVLLPDQTISMMVEGFSKSKNSIFANRLLCNYYLHIREYRNALARCQLLVQLLAQQQRKYGLDNFLPHAKTDFLKTLAIVYTYYEAPKNFPRALQLYDTVLAMNPEDVNLRVGKGIILMEKGDYDAAYNLFSEVSRQYPDNTEAVSELGWCYVKLGKHAEGREHITKALAAVTDTDVALANFRAICQWRLAYLFYHDDNVSEAHAAAIASLKENPNYAPAYTLLGELYNNAFHDAERAQKCFYKAIEIDSDEIVAAKYLVTDVTAQGEWDVAEILCNKVLELESGRRQLILVNNTDTDRDWPWRVLGVLSLNRQDDAKAIEYFQLALRVCSDDAASWQGLGEAYYHCGKLEASAKVFNHCLTEFEVNWHTLYLYGRVQCELGMFVEGLEHLLKALSSKPNEECILAGVYEAYMGQTQQLMAAGYVGRALALNSNALGYLRQFHQVNPDSQLFWKLVGECLRVYLTIQRRELVSVVDLKEIFEDIEPVGDISWDLAQAKSGQLNEFIIELVILAAVEGQRRLGLRANKYLRLAAAYNVGMAYCEGVVHHQNYLEPAITSLKQAISIEPMNAQYWVGLGNCYFYKFPQIAQHCYIKATTLDSHDALVWINLASLYLKYDDFDLAHQAFARAQSVAPTNALSWLGSAMVSQAREDRITAYQLFAHAYIVANGKVPVAQLLFGALTLSKYKAGTDPHDITTAQTTLLANFAMHKYLQYFPDDTQGQMVASNVSERCMEYNWSEETAAKQLEQFEKAYENEELEQNFVGYAQAKAQCARVILGQGEYAKALDYAQEALALIEGAEPKLELLCRITAGLCQYFLGDFDAALAQLQAILEAHPSSQRLVVLVAQILYSFNSDDTKQAALDQLFGYIEEYGSSPMVVLVLAAMLLRDDMSEYFGPVRDELVKIELKDVIRDTTQIIPDVIAAISERMGMSNATGWQRQAYLTPWLPNLWTKLDTTMALRIAELPHSKVRSDYLAKLYHDSGDDRMMQRLMILCPGEYMT